ncbi:MAG: hypothetical protein ACI9C4_002776 [Paraglaciecola sp.]|jgi:hypothetical protein
MSLLISYTHPQTEYHSKRFVERKFYRYKKTAIRVS